MKAVLLLCHLGFCLWHLLYIVGGLRQVVFLPCTPQYHSSFDVFTPTSLLALSSFSIPASPHKAPSERALILPMG